MSSRISSALYGTVAAVLLSAATVTGSFAADLIAPGAYAASAPDSVCARANHLAAIERRFRKQAREVQHQPELEIVSISDFHETRYLPKVDKMRAVERQYCRASAGMSDGRTRTLWYLIEYDEGFASFFGDNVEFCVSGLDRWNVYDASCRVLR